MTVCGSSPGEAPVLRSLWPQGGFQLSVPLPPPAMGRPVMQAGQPELSPSPATASDSGRGPGPSVTLGSLYLNRTKVGLFLPDQRVMSVFCKDPSVKCLGLYHPCCSYSACSCNEKYNTIQYNTPTIQKWMGVAVFPLNFIYKNRQASGFGLLPVSVLN